MIVPNSDFEEIVMVPFTSLALSNAGQTQTSTFFYSWVQHPMARANSLVDCQFCQLLGGIVSS